MILLAVLLSFIFLLPLWVVSVPVVSACNFSSLPFPLFALAVWPGLLARPFLLELLLWGAGGAAPRVATLLRRYLAWIDGLRA